MITVLGGEGLGKGDMLTLFKYNILNNNYYIFDYTCSPERRDPFFALIKEFSSATLSNERKSNIESDISEKLRIYLEQSEDDASMLNETKDHLQQDYEYSMQFISQLSEEKPLVFIIRDGRYLTEQTIGFLNYIARDINRLRVMIIISINDPEKIKSLKFAVRVLMKTLSNNETHKYLENIFKTEVPKSFADDIWSRSNGNPQYVIGILSDMIEKKIFLKTDSISFDVDFTNFQLPKEITQSIYVRMSQLSSVSYRYLQKLSCVFTPLTMELIREILDISKRTLYNLLSDAVNNEILYKIDGHYEFSFIEAKNRFFNECPEFIRIEISHQLIKYFQDKLNLDIKTIKGLLKSCLITQDYQALLLFKRQLFNVYHQNYDQQNAFDEIYEIVELETSDKVVVDESVLRKDIIRLINKAEMTGNIEPAFKLITSIKTDKEMFEIEYSKAIAHIRQENIELAEEYYFKAYELAVSGKQQALTLLDLMWIYVSKKDKNHASKILEQLSKYQLSNDLEICFYDRKGYFLSQFESETESIRVLEEYLSKIQETNDQMASNRLASLYSNLANLYSSQMMYSEAQKYHKMSLSISLKINNQNLLSTIYINIGDFYLRQGLTDSALEHFKKGEDLSKKLNNVRSLTLANLNFGEAHIKLGDFIKAEEYLDKARNYSESTKNKNFYDSILYNLATVKSKISSFKSYLSFLEEQNLLEHFHTLKSITPLHKNYIYYLCDVMQIEQVSEFLNSNISSTDASADEFLYQIKGIINMHKKEYALAKDNFEKSLNAANQIKSTYAITICYIRLAETNIKMTDLSDAEDNLKNAKVLAEAHQFKYWSTYIQILKVQVSLLRKEIPLRSLLRQTIHINELCETNKYQSLSIECLGMITQIYKELKATSLYKNNFGKYMATIKDIARGIPEEQYKSYISYKLPTQTPQSHLQLFQVSPRLKKDSEAWQKVLFTLLRKDVVSEIHYILEKFIRDNFAPQKFTIIYSKKNVSFDKFLERQNYTTYISLGFEESELELYHNLCTNALNSKKVQKEIIEDNHAMVAPLWLRKSCFGCLIIVDDGELAFTNTEIKTMEVFSIQLSALLIRVLEYENNEKKMTKMQDVMNLSKRFIEVHDVKRLEVDILINAISLCNAKRGVLIKKDSVGTFLFQIAYDSDRNILSSFPNISKTALLYVDENTRALFSTNILEDIIFKSSPSVLQYQINSLFCAPLLVENKIYAYLYLDNYQWNQDYMFIDEEVNNMFLAQASMALKNALDYEKLMKKNLELKTLDKMKNEFIGIVSHELNTPLTTMQGYLTRLKKNKDFFSLETSELIKKVEKSTNKLRQSINDIITLNRYNAKRELIVEKQNIAEILSTLMTEAELSSKHRRMNFKLEIEEDLPMMMVDWQAFHLMVYNIVLNSIRFTSDFGTIIIGARYAIFQKEKVNDISSVVIYVQDNGIGISEFEQENVFKSFYELGDMLAHRSGNLEYRSSGLGLGLAISKRIAELHKGKIWLRSKESEGTTVFISIPLTTPAEDNKLDSNDKIVAPELE
ncbi:MAG: tetratricopeptide repeat protein [Candidatus Cloacimonetes bacterium]|nr:tetratricopeptide repeat protein [Candidatus Cloacimonadota bacterium]